MQEIHNVDISTDPANPVTSIRQSLTLSGVTHLQSYNLQRPDRCLPSTRVDGSIAKLRHPVLTRSTIGKLCDICWNIADKYFEGVPKTQRQRYSAVEMLAVLKSKASCYKPPSSGQIRGAVSQDPTKLPETEW